MIFIKSPLEHFELNIYSYLYNFFYDFSLNSGSVYLLSLTFFSFFFFLSFLKPTIVPSKIQTIFLKTYYLVFEIFKQQVNSPRAHRFFPFIFSLFFYIFLLNFSSLYIYGVSLTGHILVTVYFSFSIFISLFIIGMLNYGFKFFNFFVPKGVPTILLDFIIAIEVFSFAIRPFSLAIRLFANMLAGHTLIGIFSKFTHFIIQNYFIFFLIPFTLVFLVFLLEIAVSLIQAYIFVNLVCIYLNDIINLH
ncbi:MAG: F0F1 ATP synthase subunit A [Candidatus Riesia sp.]|nr:F0F1 ATP synthase subunit A [Candidatus Riesia sp.]